MILNKKLENYWLILQSLPSWECGLKFGLRCGRCKIGEVAPFVGVWIEIVRQLHPNVAVESLPSWECGLKFDDPGPDFEECLVAPFVGVWIEITNVWDGTYKDNSRSLRGSVD